MKVGIRKATISDSDFIFSLVSEPTTRDVSFNQEVITREQHDSWYTQAISSNNILYFVIEDTDTGEEVGQIRVNREGTVSLTIGENYRGRGYAPGSVIELVRYLETSTEFPGLEAIYAYIRERNIKSGKTFLRAGFERTGTAQLYGHDCIIHSFTLNRLVSTE